MTNRNELIQFIVETITELEGLTNEEHLEVLEKYNHMSYEELEREADFYDEILLK